MIRKETKEDTEIQIDIEKDEKKLSTEPYKGVRDFLPEEMFVENYIFSVMRKTAESFGYAEYGVFSALLLTDGGRANSHRKAPFRNRACRLSTSIR